MSKTPIPDSYWLEKGKVLAGEYPGAETEDEARKKLKAFLKAGITYFIDLTEEHEPLEPYAHLIHSEAGKTGKEVVHRRMPIRDVSVPSIEFMDEIREAISDAVEEGHTVYIHCWGGVGRTGTVAGCYLVEQGMSGDDAIDHLARLRAGTPKARRKSPETSEQEEMIRNWVAPDDQEDQKREWEIDNAALEDILTMIPRIERMMIESLKLASLAVPVEQGEDETGITFVGMTNEGEERNYFIAFTNMDAVDEYFEGEPAQIAVVRASEFIKFLLDGDSPKADFDGLVINPASDTSHFIPAQLLEIMEAEFPDDDEE